MAGSVEAVLTGHRPNLAVSSQWPIQPALCPPNGCSGERASTLSKFPARPWTAVHAAGSSVGRSIEHNALPNTTLTKYLWSWCDSCAPQKRPHCCSCSSHLPPLQLYEALRRNAQEHAAWCAARGTSAVRVEAVWAGVRLGLGLG